ncbi:DinB family protein [Paenibacillus sp. P96]|uniref:DinB family protein n=1 Tax=Paenibacillus zeirhizosphaerae TaxID=2987519 RepID=A0ABT9FKZ3_9BACL|nr:DinB family protein [Paenibacillus sp. P96]MDP4095401.1 DinB family protein [Paenibacillus sp. P96]
MHLFDLAPQQGMTPVIGMLHAAVEDTYHRLQATCAGLSEEELYYKGPNGSLNSIAQLLKHLAVVDLHWVYRLRGESVPDELVQQFGPMATEEGRLPEIEGVPLEDLFSQYDRVQDMFRQACLILTDEDLERKVPYENGAEATVRWGIWHIADHSRYHQAHMAWLKKMCRTGL